MHLDVDNRMERLCKEKIKNSTQMWQKTKQKAPQLPVVLPTKEMLTPSQSVWFLQHIMAEKNSNETFSY